MAARARGAGRHGQPVPGRTSSVQGPARPRPPSGPCPLPHPPGSPGCSHATVALVPQVPQTYSRVFPLLFSMATVFLQLVSELRPHFLRSRLNTGPALFLSFNRVLKRKRSKPSAYRLRPSLPRGLGLPKARPAVAKPSSAQPPACDVFRSFANQSFGIVIIKKYVA